MASTGEVVLERTRLIATVVGYCKIPQKRTASESGEMKNMILFQNIRNYGTGIQITNVPQAFIYYEEKIRHLETGKFFVGATVAFDATIVFDKKRNMYRFNRMSNVCGKARRNYGYGIEETMNLPLNPLFDEFCTFGCCCNCGNYDLTNRRIKKSCEKSIFRG